MLDTTKQQPSKVVSLNANLPNNQSLSNSMTAKKSELEQPQTQQEHELKWIDGDTLADNAKAAEYYIKGILETDSHGIVGGKSMTLKTFLVLKATHSVCTGKEFFGHKVFTTGKVLYVCGEGMGALSRRIKALKLTEGDFNGNLRIVDKPIRIDNPTEMGWLRQLIEVEQPALVIFDTFASLVSETDENSPSDVGRALKLIKETCRNGRTSSLIVHHYGKDSTKGLRGASNFLNDVDFAMEMTREGKEMNAKLSCLKMKDGDDFKDIHVTAHVVELGIYEQDGNESTSLVLKAIEPSQVRVKQKNPLNKRQQDVLNELYNALDKHGVEPTPDIKARFGEEIWNIPSKVVHVDSWRELAYKVIEVNSSDSKKAAEARKKGFKSVVDALTKVQKIDYYDGYYWVI